MHGLVLQERTDVRRRKIRTGKARSSRGPGRRGRSAPLPTCLPLRGLDRTADRRGIPIDLVSVINLPRPAPESSRRPHALTPFCARCGSKGATAALTTGGCDPHSGHSGSSSEDLGPGVVRFTNVLSSGDPLGGVRTRWTTHRTSEPPPSPALLISLACSHRTTLRCRGACAQLAALHDTHLNCSDDRARVPSRSRSRAEGAGSTSVGPNAAVFGQTAITFPRQAGDFATVTVHEWLERPCHWPRNAVVVATSDWSERG
jgi:hypothetical protein